MNDIADGLRGYATEAAHAEAIDFLKRYFAG